MFASKEGPIEVVYKSNQYEYLSDPAAWLFRMILSGLVIQMLAGDWSVLSRLQERRTSTIKLPSIRFLVSIASSMKIVWPIVR